MFSSQESGPRTEKNGYTSPSVLSDNIACKLNIAELRMINGSCRYRLTACSDPIYGLILAHRNPAFCYSQESLEVLLSDQYVNVTSVEQAALLIKQEKVWGKLLSQCQSLSNCLSPGCSSSSLHNKNKIVPQ